MPFFRVLWALLKHPEGAAAMRKEKVPWSFLFRAHLFVVFAVTLANTSVISHFVQSAATAFGRVPDGVEIEQRDGILKMRGFEQPKTFEYEGDLITIDTTGAITERPVSSTVFISSSTIELVDRLGSSMQTRQLIQFGRGSDFAFSLDQIKIYLKLYEKIISAIAIAGLFAFTLLAKFIQTIVVVAVWSFAVVMVQRVFRNGFRFRDEFAMNLFVISVPLVLWGIFTIGGFWFAGAVEIAAFVVYSIVAGRSTQMLETKKE